MRNPAWLGPQRACLGRKQPQVRSRRVQTHQTVLQVEGHGRVEKQLSQVLAPSSERVVDAPPGTWLIEGDAACVVDGRRQTSVAVMRALEDVALGIGAPAHVEWMCVIFDEPQPAVTTKPTGFLAIDAESVVSG